LKILVLSDTHGNTTIAEEIVKKEEVDLCIHLGDNFKDAVYINDKLGLEVVGIRGNCDYEDYAEDEMILDIEGHKLLLTHGHQYNVKMTLNNLYYKAKSLGCSVALYGHTHKNLKEETEDVLIMNPGSLTKPRGSKASYGILQVEEDGVRAKIIEI
jgi:putative phosphoesterase